MKAVASAVLVMLAVAAVFQTTEGAAAFCRVSSYQIDPKIARANKEAMFKACAKLVPGGAPVITAVTTKEGCALLTQKVASKEAWDAYSDCEKSKKGVNNSKFYSPLKAKAGPCEKFTSKGAC